MIYYIGKPVKAIVVIIVIWIRCAMAEGYCVNVVFVVIIVVIAVANVGVVKVDNRPIGDFGNPAEVVVRCY